MFAENYKTCREKAKTRGNNLYMKKQSARRCLVFSEQIREALCLYKAPGKPGGTDDIGCL